MESPYDDLRSDISNGATPAELIVSMRRRGFTIIEAIQVAKELFHLSLGEAKALVASHFAYCEFAEASAALHDEIIQVIEDLSKNAPESL